MAESEPFWRGNEAAKHHALRIIEEGTVPEFAVATSTARWYSFSAAIRSEDEVIAMKLPKGDS